MTELLNKPRIYEWMQKEEKNFLMDMHRTLIGFVGSHQVFNDKKIKLGYFPSTGESSFIAVIQTEDQKFVFKSAKESQSILVEVAVLKEWNKYGVKIPQIIEEGTVKNHPYVIMDYIDSPLLMDIPTTDLIHKGFIREMGQTLKKMNFAKGAGYGRPTSSIFQGTFTSFDEYIKQALIENPRLSFLADCGYLDKSLVNKMENAARIVSEDITENNIQSIICHMDFSAYNIFATDPITVFDPGEARLNHPYIDLAQSFLIFFNLSNDTTLPREEFLEGYLSKDEVINEPVLNACLCLQGIKKLNTWVGKGRFAKAKVLREYISQLPL